MASDQLRPTRAEAILLDRRRRGENQTEAAARHGAALSRYSLWERDKANDIPKVKLGRLRPHERCLLYRKRCDKTQQEVADDLKMCRYWVASMERGQIAADTLVWYWEQ